MLLGCGYDLAQQRVPFFEGVVLTLFWGVWFSQQSAACSCCKCWEEVDGSGAISVLLDEASVVLGARGGVHSPPAVLTVVSQAVYVPTEVRSIAAHTVKPLALVTHLIIKDIGLHLNLKMK